MVGDFRTVRLAFSGRDGRDPRARWKLQRALLKWAKCKSGKQEQNFVIERINRLLLELECPFGLHVTVDPVVALQVDRQRKARGSLE